MTILYTITAYPPSIGGAQLHLHEFVKQIQQMEAVGVVYQWDENRTDWLKGTTLNAPSAQHPEPLDSIDRYRLSLTNEQRQNLRFWVWFYRLFQGQAIDRISDAMLDNLQKVMLEVLPEYPTVIHNSRVGRENLTVASLKLARKLNIPYVLTPNHHHHWKGWIYRHYLQVYREANALIAYTQVEKQELIQLGVQEEKIHVLGIGPLLADTAYPQQFRQLYDIPDDAPIILFLGQKYAYKRFTWLLDSLPAIWSKYPKTVAVFMGPRTDYSHKIFQPVHDKRIVEIDQVDLQTKTDALSACTFLCMPSAKESFGGVYVEAWTMGKAVIGGDAPALQEVIEHGVNGFTVSTPTDLQTCALQLLENSSFCDELARAGQEKAEQFQWNKLGQQLHIVYDGLRSTH